VSGRIARALPAILDVRAARHGMRRTDPAASGPPARRRVMVVERYFEPEPRRMRARRFGLRVGPDQPSARW